MLSKKTILRRAQALGFGLLCVSASALSAFAAPSPGWSALAKNADSEAAAQFQAALKQSPADAEALCGLALTQQEAGDKPAAATTLRRLYGSAPASWQAEALWPQTATLAQETGRWDLLTGAAQDVLAAPKASSALKASAQLALALAASRSGRAADAANRWKSLGFVRRWQVIGPFDNASQSGRDKAYPPEQLSTLGAASTGKDAQVLRWHPLGLVGLDGQCAVGQSLGDSEANVFYAVSAVQSPAAQAAVLEFDPTGATKISVNGVWVEADPVKRSPTPLSADTIAVPVTLQAGWNTVLVKLSDTETLGAAFSLRVTDPVGTTLFLAADPAQAKLVPVTGMLPGPPSAGLAARLHLQAPSLASAALLGRNLRLAHDYQASADTLRSGLAANPDSGLLHWELSQTLSDDDQDDEARAERGLALKQNPRLVEAQLDALKEAEDTVSADELVRRARAAAAAAPKSADAQWALSRAYDKAKLNAAALQAARKAYALAPGADFLADLVTTLTDQNKNTEAAALLASALKTAPGDTSLLSAQRGLFADQDNVPGGIAVTRRLLALDPADRRYRSGLAALLQQAGQASAALENLRLARLQRPQDSGTCTALADLLQEKGQSKEAAALYREAIRLNPAELTLRDKLAVLLGTKPVVDLAPETDSAPILAAAAHLKPEPGASAILLLDEGRTVVYPDFATLTRYHQIIKIVDQSAADRYARFPLSRPTSTAQVTVESARAIKADGKVQDVTDSAGRYSVSFPSLVPGDLLDIAYRVEDYHPGGLAHEFWGQWSFDGTDRPSRLSRFVLIAPPSLVFATQNHGPVPAPTVRDTGGWRVHEWRMTDIPAHPSEIAGTAETDSGTWLDLSTITSWATVVQWYEDLSAPRCVPDAVLRAKALELTKDAKTDREKLQAIQTFVAREVQYQSSPFRLSAYVPTEGKDVLRDRYGDCKDKAALLTALLAAVGVKSEMVLLSGRSHGLTPYLPSPRFNHAIARVQTAEGPLFVDATADQLGFGDLPSEDQQVPVLVIAPATTALSQTPLLPADDSAVSETYTNTLDAAGTLRGTLDWTLTGQLAWEMRSSLRGVPEAKRQEAMRGLAGYVVKGAECDSSSLEHLSEPNLPLTLHFALHADHYSTSAGSFLLLPLPWSGESKDESIAALTAGPKRTQDLEVASGRGATHSIAALRLPPGYAPQEVPADVHQESPYGTLKVHYAVKGNLLTATRDIRMTALRVPAAEVPKYAAFLKTISEETGRQIVLKKL